MITNPNINPETANLQQNPNNPGINDPIFNNGLRQEDEDRQLFQAMKDIKEMKEEKDYNDIYSKDKRGRRVNEDKESHLKEGEDQHSAKHLTKQQAQSKFKTLLYQNSQESNSYRKWLLHIIVCVIVLDCIFWEVLCLFMNTCFGESLVMQGWLSQTICPLIFILLLMYVFLFFCSDYLYQSGIQIINIALILIIVLFIGFGVYGLIRVLIISEQTLLLTWNQMSSNSRTFYQTFAAFTSLYKRNMFVTVIWYFVIAVTGIIIWILSFQFYNWLTLSLSEWRPPMRSRLNDYRVNRIIKLYDNRDKNDEENWQLLKEMNQGSFNKLPEVQSKQVPRGGEWGQEGIEMQNINNNINNNNNDNNNDNNNNVINNNEGNDGGNNGPGNNNNNNGDVAGEEQKNMRRLPKKKK